MRKNEIFQVLSEKLNRNQAAKALIQKMEERYADMENVNKEDLLYWLDESLYSTLAWQKKHEEEDELEKAQEEASKASAIEKVMEALKQLNQ